MIIKEKKQRTKKYKTEIERINSIRTSKAKYQREYRKRIKSFKEFEFNKQLEFNRKYRNDIFSSIQHLDVNYQCTLHFKLFRSIEQAAISIRFFTDAIKPCINNVIYTFEYGVDKNIHVHLAIEFRNEFLDLYSDKKSVEKYVLSKWNNGSIANGKVWVNMFKNIGHKRRYLKYMLKQLKPESKWNNEQKQCDYYYIQSFKNNNIYNFKSDGRFNISYDYGGMVTTTIKHVELGQDVYHLLSQNQKLEVLDENQTVGLTLVRLCANMSFNLLKLSVEKQKYLYWFILTLLLVLI